MSSLNNPQVFVIVVTFIVLAGFLIKRKLSDRDIDQKSARREQALRLNLKARRERAKNAISKITS